jgi:chemotaxis response regulator CheB
VLRVEVDHNNESGASVFRKCRKKVLQGVNAAGRGANGDDHRFGVFSLRYGVSFVFVIARHDATPRPKLPAETYPKCRGFASCDPTASEPWRRTQVASGNRPGSRVVSSFGNGAAEYGMANRDVLAIGTSAGGVEALIFLAKQFRREFPEIARLGGYLARANDGPPGNKVIWRGLSHLN